MKIRMVFVIIEFSDGMMYLLWIILLGPQKNVCLFSRFGRVKFFYHSPTRKVEYVSEYIFLISKNKQTSKKNKNTKQAKETKKEKKISPENQLKK